MRLKKKPCPKSRVAPLFLCNDVSRGGCVHGWAIDWRTSNCCPPWISIAFLPKKATSQFDVNACKDSLRLAWLCPPGGRQTDNFEEGLNKEWINRNHAGRTKFLFFLEENPNRSSNRAEKVIFFSVFSRKCHKKRTENPGWVSNLVIFGVALSPALK